MSDLRERLTKEHGDLTDKLFVSRLSDDEAARLEVVRRALDYLDMAEHVAAGDGIGESDMNTFRDGRASMLTRVASLIADEAVLLEMDGGFAADFAVYRLRRLLKKILAKEGE